MNTQLRPLFFLVTLYTAACGCITNTGNSAQKAPEPIAPSAASAEEELMAKTRVRSDLQRKMLAELKAEQGLTIAYGLFSEGGWSDAGQTWILANEGLSKMAAYRIDTNKEDVRKLQPSNAQLDNMRKILASTKGLTDVNEEMFDGLIYELSIFETSGQELKAATSIYIKSVDLTRHPEHNRVINAFHDLAEPHK